MPSIVSKILVGSLPLPHLHRSCNMVKSAARITLEGGNTHQGSKFFFYIYMIWILTATLTVLSLIFRLRSILFPTLICCCFNNSENKNVVAQEVSPTLLAMFLQVRPFCKSFEGFENLYGLPRMSKINTLSFFKLSCFLKEYSS